MQHINVRYIIMFNKNETHLTLQIDPQAEFEYIYFKHIWYVVSSIWDMYLNREMILNHTWQFSQLTFTSDYEFSDHTWW